MTNTKSYKTELYKHLFHMHGEFTIRQGEALSLGSLEVVHEIFHADEHMCPNHKHGEVVAYQIGQLELALGEDYVAEVIETARAEI